MSYIHATTGRIDRGAMLTAAVCAQSTRARAHVAYDQVADVDMYDRKQVGAGAEDAVGTAVDHEHAKVKKHGAID